MLVILDNGHGINTPGKASPDKSLREYSYTRDIVNRIYEQLKEEGIDSYILVPEEEDISLSERVARANKLYSEYNKEAILVSVHCNASGSGDQWKEANGWSVFISPNASSKSKELASCLAKQALKLNIKVRQQYPDCYYWKQSLAICRDTNCPAILTENMFQDNRKDVEFLLSEQGKNIITSIHVDGIKEYLKR